MLGSGCEVESSSSEEGGVGVGEVVDLGGDE